MDHIQYSFPILDMNCASFCCLASNRLQEMCDLPQLKNFNKSKCGLWCKVIYFSSYYKFRRKGLVLLFNKF